MSAPRSSSPSTTYAVAGMSCGHCERAVQGAIEALPTVEQAQVDQRAGTVTVTGGAERDEIARAVHDAGYDLAS